jgi:hypothetical protein
MGAVPQATVAVPRDRVAVNSHSEVIAMSQTLEKRVAVLESELAELKKSIRPDKPWWRAIQGGFANDPAFKEAMRLGREYRESLRPKSPARKKRKR